MTDDAAVKPHRRSPAALLLELGMIVVGVFLGASAEQLRENRHQHVLAVASLQNLRQEAVANRAKILKIRAYHQELVKSVDAFLDSNGPHDLQSLYRGAKFRGMNPVEFEHTAWDLAVATQALSDIDPQLALSTSHLYTVQKTLESLQDQFMQNMFAPTTFANPKDATGLAIAMEVFLGDVNIQEPRLIKLYDALLPQIDAALGTPVASKRDTTTALAP